MSLVTPYSELLDEGTYELSFQQEPVLSGVKYRFQAWSDGVPIVISAGNVVRTISLNSTININASFVEVSTVANVTFSGTRTVTPGPTPSGETITIVVTKPDTTKDTFTTLTGSSGAFTVTRPYTVIGTYSAQASVASAPAAQSPSAGFTISAGTLTLAVTVA